MEGLGGATSFDASGVLFFDYIASPNTNAVASIAGQCHAKSLVQYTPALGFIGALQFNSHNDIVIQQINGNFGGPVDTFAHPQNGALGKLLSTTNLGMIDGHPVLMLSLSSDGNGIWASPVFASGVGYFKY